jgi:FkbM family methyltransferase
VWKAYRARRPLPPFELSRGITLYHGEADDPILLFREIFVEQDYTSGGFYTPRPTDTVFDLGANIGFFSLFLQWAARGVRVHAFEPASQTRARLEQNVAENGLGAFVTVHPFAVSDTPGVLRLKQASFSAHRSLFTEEPGEPSAGAEESVRCVSLAEAVGLCGVDEIDLLKIDVEGAEIEIVEGCDDATWRRVRRVVVEYHDVFRPGCRERVSRVLEAQGFPSIETLPAAHDPDLGLIRARRDAGTPGR